MLQIQKISVGIYIHFCLEHRKAWRLLEAKYLSGTESSKSAIPESFPFDNFRVFFSQLMYRSYDVWGKNTGRCGVEMLLFAVQFLFMNVASLSSEREGVRVIGY